MLRERAVTLAQHGPGAVGAVVEVTCLIDTAHCPRPGSEPPGVARFGAYRAQWALVDAFSEHPSITIKSGGMGSESVSPPNVQRVVHHVGQVFEAPPGGWGVVDRDLPFSSNHHSLAYAHLLDAVVDFAAHRNDPRDRLVASSFAGARVLENMLASAAPNWPGTVTVIPLPVDPVEQHAERRMRCRTALGLGGAHVLLLSLGRLSLHDKASLEPLISTLALMRAEGLPARLVIAGDDESCYSADLSMHARMLGVDADVSIVSDVSDQERLDLLAAADIFVSLFDSAQESFGLAVAEAQAAGLPCVCSDFSSIGEIVVDGHTGYLVPTTWHDVGDQLDRWRRELDWRAEHLRTSQLVSVDRGVLADRVRRLVIDRALRRQMASAARTASGRFAPNVVAAAYVEMWGAAAEAPPAGARVRRPFRASDVFGEMATRRYSIGAVVWRPRVGLRPTELIPARVITGTMDRCKFENLCKHLESEVQRTVALTDIAAELGLVREVVERGVTVLAKYGFLEVLE